MSTDPLELVDGCFTEPLDLESSCPIWAVIFIEKGKVIEIRLELERPRGLASIHGIARILKGWMCGKDFSGMLGTDIRGTNFQKAVWEQVSRIPPGHLSTYGAIAKALSCRSPRAVGQALKKNPLPIIIPCHRVVGQGGKLTGFSSGIKIKKMLIEFEAKWRNKHENSSL